MDEVATGPETAILMLVVVPTHLLAQGGLMQDQFLHPVCEKTALPVHTVATLGEAAAQLQLTLRTRLRQALVAYLAHQTIIIIPHTHTHQNSRRPAPLRPLPASPTALEGLFSIGMAVFQKEGRLDGGVYSRNKTYLLFQKQQARTGATGGPQKKIGGSGQNAGQQSGRPLRAGGGL